MNLKKTAMTLGLAVLTLGATAVSAYAATAYAVGSVNVRSGPGTGYRVVDQLYRGERVDVIDCRGSWCRVEKAGPDGWVSARYLGNARDYDDDYYDDYDDDVIIVRPRHRQRVYYYDDYYPSPSASFCLGGPNASFCLNGY
jgi:uncharacterized protein YraI